MAPTDFVFPCKMYLLVVICIQGKSITFYCGNSTKKIEALIFYIAYIKCNKSGYGRSVYVLGNYIRAHCLFNRGNAERRREEAAYLHVCLYGPGDGIGIILRRVLNFIGNQMNRF